MYITKDEVACACLPFTHGADHRTEAQVRDYVAKVLGHRAYERFKPVGAWFQHPSIDRVILAGGAMLHAEPRDLDLWCGPGEALAVLAPPATNGRVGQHKVGDLDVQVCVVEEYGQVLPLRNLLGRFDFAHCQVGAEFQLMKNEKEVAYKWVVTDVQWTPAFEAAMLVQGTSYNAAGHQAVWRENSLARLPEVARKFGLSRGECRVLVQQILACIDQEPKQATDLTDPHLW